MGLKLLVSGAGVAIWFVLDRIVCGDRSPVGTDEKTASSLNSACNMALQKTRCCGVCRMVAADNKFIAQRLGFRMWLTLGMAIAAPVMVVPGVGAQQALPPPPGIGGDELPSLAPVPPPQGAASFPAVNMQIPPVDAGLTGTSFPGVMPPPAIAPAPYSPSFQAPLYRVVVNGASPYLLQQIQQTVPTASIQSMQGSPVIYVGEYASQGEALQQVQGLAQQGISAQVLSNDSGNAPTFGAGMNPPLTASAYQGPHFQVVVPTRPEEFNTIANKMVGMGVKPESIQAKRAPLGPHIAVGPILNEGEAESVSRYLRSGGMDARVYYAR